MGYQITNEDKALIAICTQTNLSYNKIRIIIETLDDVSVIFSDDIESFLIGKLDKKELNAITNIDTEVLESYISTLSDRGIEIFTILSNIYPERLKETLSPPIVMYAKGNLDLLNVENTLAIVGTRRCTNYGEEVTRSFSRVLAKNNICIISGLADGIDTIAHKGALDVKGKTIAVMGSGFDHIYPATNTELANRIIANNGLIITEYMPSELPQSYHFPARNRIVAGLSKGVLIVEAPARSGALITKEYALDCNRELFVVPGRITDIYSKGSNEVIKSCQGSIVLSVQDILDAFGKEDNNNSRSESIQLSMEEELIYNLLTVNDKHYEEILVATNLQPAQLNRVLMQLELKNIVKKLPGNMYTSVRI